MIIALTRDSVAAGDDMDAPHARDLTLDARATLSEFCAAIQEQRYLAQIAGGAAAWVVSINDVDVAVLAQQWRRPLCLIPAETPLARLCPAGRACKAHIAYKAQVDPVALAKTLGQTGGGT